MRASFTHLVKESSSIKSRPQGNNSVLTKSGSNMVSNHDNIFDLDQSLATGIKERISKIETTLSLIANQVMELFSQNKSFLQVLLTNNSQLETIATSICDAELIVSNLNNIVNRTVPTQPKSRRWNTVRSASLPVCSRSYGTSDSLTSGSTPSPQHDVMRGDTVPVIAPNISNGTAHVPSIFHRDAFSPLQPLATALSVQRPGSPEQKEAAALLAASAAAQVMAEQHGLEDLDTVFYNKVLTKLLSPEPNTLGGNWDMNMSRRTAVTTDFAMDANDNVHKYKKNVKMSPISLTDANINRTNSPKQDLSSITYPISNLHNSQEAYPVVLQESVPISQEMKAESPVGPGATLTFKGSQESFSQKGISQKVSVGENFEYIKIPAQSDPVLHVHCNSNFSTVAHEPNFSLKHNNLDPEAVIADKFDSCGSMQETTNPQAVDLVSADLSIGPQTPDTISQPQLPHILTDELQMLVAVAEPRAVVMQSDQALTSISTEKSKAQNADRITSVVKQRSMSKRSASKCTPRPRSVSKPKQKSRSQPTSRSSSRRNSLHKQESVTTISPFPQLSKPSPTKTQAKHHMKPIQISTQPNSRYSIMSHTSTFNSSSNIHVGSTGPNSMASMSLSIVGTRPGAKSLPRSSSLPLSNAINKTQTDKSRLNMILEKYSKTSGLLSITEEQKSNHNNEIGSLEYKKVFTNVILFMRFFLDHSNCDPFSPLPTDDLLTKYASVLCEKMQHVQLDTVGKHLIITAEWMVEQFTAEHFFEYIVTQSFIAEHFIHFPKTLSEVSLEISADNRRRREDYDKLMIEYEIERKKLSPRSKRQDKPEEPRKYTMEQFHTAFKRCLRNMWGPELERELIYYFYEKYMDMTITEGIILQEVTEFVENPRKSIFPDHNLYNYADLFNKYQKNSLSSIPESGSSEGIANQCVAYNLYFYYCLLSIYLLLNDCLPIRFNLYFMNYRTFQGVFRYINPEDLENPMNMSSSFRLYWPAWKDIRRGTLRLYCKFIEIKRTEKSTKVH